MNKGTTKINLDKSKLKELVATSAPKESKKIIINKDKKAIVDKTNEKRHIEQVVTQREVKWKYSEDCTDTVARKKFRQTSRAAIRKIEREIALLAKGKDEKKLNIAKKELLALRKKLLHHTDDAV